MMLGTCADEKGLDVRAEVARLPKLDLQMAHSLMASWGFGPLLSARLIESYSRDKPGTSLSDVLIAIKSDAMFRFPSLTVVERKASQLAPVFAYLFARRRTALGTMEGADHAMDIRFFFDNLNQAPGLAGPHPDPVIGILPLINPDDILSEEGAGIRFLE